MKNIFIHVPKPFVQKGFTIVELMVATLVFSVILIVITAGVLSFSNDYYKGINSSTTQNTARNIVDTITQSIQFSGGSLLHAPAAGTVTTYCIGNLQFDFVLGKEIAGLTPATTTADALYQSSRAPGSGCTASSCNLATGTGPGCTGKELLGPHMRLSNFVITQLPDGLYSITVRVVYGEDDLLVPAATATNATCSGNVGSQFCDVSELTTTVQPRIIGG